MFDEKELEAIFSVIPKLEADRARAALSANFSKNSVSLDGEVGWIDCDAEGTILRAGQTDIGGMTSRLIMDPAEAPLLHELLEYVAAGDVRPGTIGLSAAADRIIWFVPITRSSLSNATHSVVKGLNIGLDVFEALLAEFNPDAGLTKTEAKVVAHVTAGLSLEQSAQREDLSTETRRGQFKRACAKMQVTGQAGLVRLVLSQVVQILFLVSDDTKFTEVAEDYVRTYLPPDVRFDVQRLSNGRLIRVLSLGPEDGTPMVAFHGLLFPMLLHAFSGKLEAHGLRLILPLRAGYLTGDGGSFAAETNAIDLNNADFATYISSQFDAPVAIIGHSLGAVTALRFADSFPHLTRATILLSPYFGKTSEQGSGYLNRILGILLRLSSNRLAFRYVAQQFAQSYTKKHNARSALTQIFGTSQSDAAAIANETHAGSVLKWFGETFRISSSGLADDFRAVTRTPKSMVLTGPVLSIIGDSDPLTPVDAPMPSHLHTAQSDTIVVPGAGHFLTETHTDALLELLKKSVA